VLGVSSDGGKAAVRANGGQVDLIQLLSHQIELIEIAGIRVKDSQDILRVDINIMHVDMRSDRSDVSSPSGGRIYGYKLTA
jgi:hypothetical protein